MALILACLVMAPGARASTGAPKTVSSYEAQQVRMINQFRAARGLPTLRVDRRLTTVATWMALDMPRNRYFGHTDSLGRDPFRRLQSFSYPSNAWRGENLAAGYPDAGRTYTQWLNSPPHKANWLNPNYTAIGIARVRIPGSQFGYYWVTEFGSQWLQAPS